MNITIIIQEFSHFGSYSISNLTISLDSNDEIITNIESFIQPKEITFDPKPPKYKTLKTVILDSINQINGNDLFISYELLEHISFKNKLDKLITDICNEDNIKFFPTAVKIENDSNNAPTAKIYKESKKKKKFFLFN